jgi:N-acetylmuramoyl-L-alanine amidase
MKEADLTKELRALVAAEMKLLNYKFKTDDDDLSLGETFDWIRKAAKPTDVVVDIHFNSGPPTTSGTETIIPLKSSPVEQEIGKLLATGVSTILGVPNRGCKDERHTPPGHAMMSLGCESILLEICFMTNPTEMQAYQAKKLEVAKRIAADLKKWST